MITDAHTNDFETQSFPFAVAVLMRTIPTIPANKIQAYGSTQFGLSPPSRSVFLFATSIIRDTRSENDSPNFP
jgi:hypothetical protein